MKTIKHLRFMLMLLMAFLGVNVAFGALTAHEPGVYEKAAVKGGYGIDLTTVGTDNYEVYYFSANSKYGAICTGVTPAQYRLSALDANSEHILLANSGNATGWHETCDWIDMNMITTGFAKSDYQYTIGDTYGEFFSTTINGGTSGYTKTCFIKPYNQDVITIKVKGYTEFAILAKDNSTTKYLTVKVDDADPVSWKSTTLSRRSVALTTAEHTIVIACVGTSANNIYGFSLKVPAANPYTVTFNANGGTCGTSSLTEASAGAGVELPSATPADEATQEFRGWAVSSTETDPAKIFAAGETYEPAEDVTLYAIYGAKTVKSAIVYANTKGASTAALPTQYTEGVGIAEFAALEDVAGFHFTGWNPSSISAEATGEQTITAEWEAIPTDIFKMVMKSFSSDVSKTSADPEFEVNSSYTSSITGGSVYGGCTNASSKKVLSKNGQVALAGNDAYLKIVLDEDLRVGDVISFVGGTVQMAISLGKTMNGVNALAADPAKAVSTTDGKYTVSAGDLLLGETVIYVWRATGSSTAWTTIKVSRPADSTPNQKWNITFNMQGATSAAIEAQSVMDGKKAVKPEDPEKEGSDFAGWVVAATEAAYDWDAAVTADVALKATWQAAATKYTVTYKDGETTLDTEEVAEGEKAANVPAPKKELNHFAGWEDAEHNAIDFATATINADLTVYAQWTPMGEATSIDIEQFVIDNTKSGDIKAELTAHNFDYNLTLGDSKDGLDDVQAGKDYENVAYRGLKLKINGSYIVGNIPANTRVNVVIGTLGTAKVQVNGADAAALAGGSGDDDKSVKENYHNANNYYDFAEAGVLKVLSTGTSTTVLKGIILGEIPAVSDDATLSAIKLDGVDIAGFAAGTRVYNVRLAYGASLPEVTATVNNEHATYTIYPATAENNYYATIRVTAEAGNTLDYQVRFTWAPKQGACIIKATHTGATTASVEGLIGGSVDKNTQAGGKLGSNDHYFGIKLAEGTFLAGDVLTIYASTTSTKVQIFSDKGTNMLNEGVFVDNKYTFTLEAATEWIYLYRTSDGGSNMNPTLGYMEVQRNMDPIIKSFTIGEAEGVIDQEAKTIAVSVPFGTDVTALTPEVEAYANGGATVTPTGAQDFTSPKTYTVSSAYVEDAPVSYEVTVSVAAPACPTTVTITGTKTYTAGATIELTATANGTGEMTYQWKKDGVAIDGAIAATFSKTAAMDDAGDYTCVVSQGTCEAVESEAYAVVVNKNPVSSVAVASEGDVVRIKKGESINLTATVTPADATYPEVTWSSEGTPAYFTFADVNANPAVAVANKVGTSKKVYAKADGKTGQILLTCYTVVTYNVNGGDAIVDAEYDGGTAITLPTPTGGTEPFLGWYTDAEFTNKAGNAGASYKPADNVTLYAKWTMPDAETPAITTQPVGATYDEGAPMTALTVVASVSEGTLSYQWYKGSSVIEGATAAEFTPTEAGTYKVVVTNTLADHNPASATSENAVITVNRAAVEQSDVTVSTTWNWANAGSSVDKGDGVSASGVLANEDGITNDVTFNSQALVYAGRYPNRGGYFQGGSISFHTTIAGMVAVQFSNTGGNAARTARINGSYDAEIASTGGSAKATFTSFVEAGDVVIEGIQVSDEATKDIRIYSITFTAATQIRPGLNVGDFGTMCQAKPIAALGGAIVYEIEKKNAIGLDLVEAEFPLVAGKPYFYQATATTVNVIYGEGEAATEVAANGLVGRLSTATGTEYVPEGMYVIQLNNLRKVTTSNIMFLADRAYINYDAVEDNAVEDDPQAAPRRRVTMGGVSADVVTSIDEISAETGATKFIENGILYIRRGGKVYSAQGQLVK